MPTVGGTHFKYDKEGIQKAKAWAEITGKPMQMDEKSKGRKYQPGGQVSSRVTADVLEPSSLDEAAHKRIPGGTLARYTAQTKGGEQRHIVQEIPGEGDKKAKREVALRGLRDALKANPDFGDTVSFQNAKAFIENKSPSLWDMFLDYMMEETGETPKYHMGGYVPQHNTNMYPSMPMQNNNLANMGRMGDTMIRPVDGEPAHVNRTEANWIDNYGPAGQQMTQAMGSGTINPRTGLPEYAWYNDINWWFGENSAIGQLVASEDKTYEVSTSEYDRTMCDNYGADHPTNAERDCGSGFSLGDVFSALATIGAPGFTMGGMPEPGEMGSGVNVPGSEGTSELEGLAPPLNYIDIETPEDLKAYYDAGGSDMTQVELDALLAKFSDNTTYEPPEFEEGDPPPPPPVVPPEKALNTWGFSKFGESSSDWLEALNELLGIEYEPSFQTGGQVPQGRRMYGDSIGSPMKYSMKGRKRRPRSLQTSTAGMPSRPSAPQKFRGGGMARMKPGMKMVEPYLKSYRAGGSVPKGWHV